MLPIRTYVIYNAMGCFGIDNLNRNMQEVVFTTELTDEQMKVLEKDIDVICVFYHGKIPEPRKFKIKYKNGTVKTVEIDLVKRTEVQNPNNLLDMVKVLYDCQSEVEDKIIGYQALLHEGDALGTV